MGFFGRVYPNRATAPGGSGRESAGRLLFSISGDLTCGVACGGVCGGVGVFCGSGAPGVSFDVLPTRSAFGWDLALGLGRNAYTTIDPIASKMTTSASALYVVCLVLDIA